MPGGGKAMGGSVNRLTVPFSISGPRAAGFGRVRACGHASVRIFPPFYLQVTVVKVKYINKYKDVLYFKQMVLFLIFQGMWVLRALAI